MFKIRSLLVFAGAALLVIVLVPGLVAAQDATPALRFESPISLNSCGADGISMSYIVHHDYTYSPSITILSSGTINGVVVFNEGTLLANLGAPLSFPTTYPFSFNTTQPDATYTYIHTWTTRVDGVAVYQSSLSGTCIWMGEGFDPGAVSISNQDLSVSGAGAVVPGCDVSMPISSTSVIGTFTQTASTYWSPGNLTNPLVSIEAGKSAWVLGMDSTQQYYKIIWVCDLLWVPVNTIGPNYDAVWNGTLLPTDIVK
ncbi:MAG: hypothetical protein HY866_13105 [Chloroflexi bacterium]|nr:hypothetical protein [Chloroflexota bacterium]